MTADPTPLIEAVARAWNDERSRYVIYGHSSRNLPELVYAYPETDVDAAPLYESGYGRLTASQWIDQRCAHAALHAIAAALREPSEAMRDAGWDSGRVMVSSNPDEIVDGIWGRMFLAFLREHGIDDAIPCTEENRDG